MGVRSWLKRRLRGGDRPEPEPSPPPRSSLPEPEGDFHAVAAAEAITEDRPGTYAVGDDIVAVFRAGGALFAIDNACVHEDGPLGEGHVEDGVVVCPYHDWRYDLRTGACLTEPDRAVGCFEVREKDGLVWVGRRTSRTSRARGGEHDDGLPTVDER